MRAVSAGGLGAGWGVAWGAAGGLLRALEQAWHGMSPAAPGSQAAGPALTQVQNLFTSFRSAVPSCAAAAGCCLQLLLAAPGRVPNSAGSPPVTTSSPGLCCRHMQAEEVLWKGIPQRFCQQVGTPQTDCSRAVEDLPCCWVRATPPSTRPQRPCCRSAVRACSAAGSTSCQSSSKECAAARSSWPGTQSGGGKAASARRRRGRRPVPRRQQAAQRPCLPWRAAAGTRRAPVGGRPARRGLHAVCRCCRRTRGGAPPDSNATPQRLAWLSFV